MPKEIKTEIEKNFQILKAEFVAVRSSATAEDSASAAWAGQLESYLNTTSETLLVNVQKCWASLFTPRAIFYRFEKGLHVQKISVAVVVQKMVQSEVAGIAFSVHPVTQDRNQLIIEAGIGLGEAVVSGQITPDSYVVSKNDVQILDKNVSEQARALRRHGVIASGAKQSPEIATPSARDDDPNVWSPLGPEGKEQKLSDQEILELSKLVIHIENHYGFPVDVEWARENRKFYIVQSRPITTLNDALKKEKIDPVDMIGSIDDYKRLFRVGGLSYFVSDVIMNEYKTIQAVLMSHKDVWTSHLTKQMIEQTLAEGLDLYRDTKKFTKYKKDFAVHTKEATIYFEEALRHEVLSKKQIQTFIEHVSQLFFFYRRTEFFATDEAYQFSLHDETTRKNLREFEQIKNSGRAFLNKIFFGKSSYLTQFFTILSRQFHLTPKILNTYRCDELLQLFNDVKVSEDIIQARQHAFVMVGTEPVHYMHGSQAADIVSRFRGTSSDKPQQEMKGQIAHKGVARGTVKVILADYGNFDQLTDIMNDMQKGDILVAETTSPELILACSKAAAIVTNQGGMMSHAAIVSREMNIPCIVGTGNATDVLHDGDLVEVDANQGVVRLLS